MAGGDQPLIVGEVARDQPGRQLRVPDHELGVVLGQLQRHLLGVVDQALQLVQGAARHQDLLPLAQQRRPFQVPDRQPI